MLMTPTRTPAETIENTDRIFRCISASFDESPSIQDGTVFARSGPHGFGASRPNSPTTSPSSFVPEPVPIESERMNLVLQSRTYVRGRHCEPKAKQSSVIPTILDCFVASLLAMTAFSVNGHLRDLVQDSRASVH